MSMAHLAAYLKLIYTNFEPDRKIHPLADWSKIGGKISFRHTCEQFKRKASRTFINIGKWDTLIPHTQYFRVRT